MSALKLGKNQQSCLEWLYSRKGWFPGCGWIWNGRSGTIRIMESLVKKGVAVKSGSAATPQYTINKKGLEHLKVTNPIVFKYH
ncbi:MAG: hypothetical protein ACRDCA_12565 [Serratia sp. (in: enterobacteria)]|uniref:hypothetical protein n=1 Tax=Serratia sp. (in: enterobacteria) TaxID=616 RepID=UPI003F373974